MRLLLFFQSCLFLAACGDSDSTNIPNAGLGIMVGEVTPASVHIQVRLSEGMQLLDRDLAGVSGSVLFSLKEYESKGDPALKLVEASADRDFIARASFDNLKPGTHYICKTSLAPKSVTTTSEEPRHLVGKENGPTATFKTLPGRGKSVPAKFVVVTGMNYAKFHGDNRIDRAQHLLENNTDLPKPYSGPDKELGYPALESILKLEPDFFVGTGDNVYYDTPDNPRAESITELRQKWHEQFVQPRFRDLFAKVPTYWMIDDHDYRIDDGDNSGDHKPSPEMGRRMMLEQLPVAASSKTKTAKTYRTHRVTDDLQIWFLENRMYRSDNATKDGPGKTIWGPEQKVWLKETLQESDATFKVLISPTPMIGPDDIRKTDNHTNHGGFRHERDEFFSWLKETGLDNQNFYIICGDRHWQYQSIHPSGIEEFSCGALIDANSRLGRQPGESESTDPEGLIKQPYSQKVRSGGFLMVTSTSPKSEGASAVLTFIWHDEKGVVLHKTEKYGPKVKQ